MAEFVSQIITSVTSSNKDASQTSQAQTSTTVKDKTSGDPAAGHLKDIIQEYSAGKPDPDPTVPPISEHLVPNLKIWWWKPAEKDQAKTLLEQCLHPENADTHHQVFMNEELFKQVGSKGRDLDQPLRYINNSLTKGAVPLESAWNEVICAESLLEDLSSSSNHDAMKISLPDGSSLDLLALQKQLDLSLQVLGLNNAQIVTQRKSESQTIPQ